MSGQPYKRPDGPPHGFNGRQQTQLASAMMEILRVADVPKKQRALFLVGISAELALQTGRKLDHFDHEFGIKVIDHERYVAIKVGNAT